MEAASTFKLSKTTKDVNSTERHDTSQRTFIAKIKRNVQHTSTENIISLN